jgi:glycosyltransferase involved in cell wall biosynthesis
MAVVVATYRRAHLLAQLVAGLDAQDFDQPFEVVLVDDCSPDGASSVLAELAPLVRFPLRILRTDRNRGPASARNLGWRSSSAPLLAFTDDDCIPQPGWLSGLVAALARVDVVQGATLPNPQQMDRVGAFSRSLRITAPTSFFETANMGYRRRVLEDVGGFDESFPLAAGDLGHRALAAGASFAFAPDAVIHHEVHASSFVHAVAKTKSWQGLVRVVVRYPELRRHFDGGRYVWHRRHRLALFALVGLTISLWRPRRTIGLGGIALILPYVNWRLRSEPLCPARAERIARLPQALVFDLAECTHATIGQIQSRADALGG